VVAEEEEEMIIHTSLTIYVLPNNSISSGLVLVILANRLMPIVSLTVLFNIYGKISVEPVELSIQKK